MSNEFPPDIARRIANSGKSMARERDEALALHDRCSKVLEHELRPEVERAVRQTRSILAMGLLKSDLGEAASALSNFVRGQASWGEAKRLFMLPDAERGQKNLESTARGGNNSKRPSTPKRLQMMDDYIAEGRNVSEAADFTYRNGLGPSPGANRALYYKHRGGRKL